MSSFEALNGRSPDLPPALMAMEPILAESLAYINVETCGPYVERFHNLEVTISEWPMALQEAYGRAALKLAGLLFPASSTPMHPENEEAFIKNIAESRLAAFSGDKNVSSLPLRALGIVESQRSLDSYARQLKTGLEDRIDDNEAAFQVLTGLVKPTRKPVYRMIENHYGALQTLAAYDFAAYGSESLVRKIDTKLTSGELDSLLAKELLDLATTDGIPSAPEASKELAGMARFIGRLIDGGREDIIARLCSPALLENWPDHYKKFIGVRRQDYKTALHANLYTYKEFLESCECIPEESSLGKLDQSLDVMLKELSRNGEVELRTRVVAREVVLNLNKRKNQPDYQPAQPQQEEAPTAEEPNETPKERALVFVNGNGQKFDEGSEEYTSFIDDYLSAHVGVAGISEDVANMLEWLKTADFGAGLPRGIKKIEIGTTGRGSKPRKIYRLRPGEAIGLPTKSKIGPKIRIMFQINNGSIELLGLEDKNAISNLYKKLGVHASSRGSK